MSDRAASPIRSFPAGQPDETQKPRGVTHLRLADTEHPPSLARGPSFVKALAERGIGELRRERVTTLQVNVGKLCNQACHHCHVEAGPKRTEIMPLEVADRVVELVSPAARSRWWTSRAARRS